MSLFSSGNVFSVPSFSHRTSFRGGTCALSPTLKARFDQAVMGSMAREPGTWGHSLFVVVIGAGNPFSLLQALAFVLGRHMLCPGPWRLLTVAIARKPNFLIWVTG